MGVSELKFAKEVDVYRDGVVIDGEPLPWSLRPEGGVQMALREVREEVRTLGYRQTRRNRVSPTR